MATLVRITQRKVRRLNKEAIQSVLDSSKRITGFEGWHVGCRVTSRSSIAKLNQEYRHKRGPTDCLSFTAVDWTAPERPVLDVDASNGDAGLRDLGDMILAADIIERDAARLGSDREAHWRLIVVHSFVHLLGHDHETEEQASLMEPRVEGILADLSRLNLPRITGEPAPKRHPAP